jgi:aldose sugar dehydrogenase
LIGLQNLIFRITGEPIQGPTALKFLNSDKPGKQYENTFFTRNVNTGNLYNFKLNADRTELLLRGALEDKIGDTHHELRPVIFGQGYV